MALKIFLVSTALSAAATASAQSKKLTDELSRRNCQEGHAAEGAGTPDATFGEAQDIGEKDQAKVDAAIAGLGLSNVQRLSLKAWSIKEGKEVSLLVSVVVYGESEKGGQQGFHQRALVLVLEPKSKVAQVIHKASADATEAKYLTIRNGGLLLNVLPRHFDSNSKNGGKELILDIWSPHSYWKEAFIRRPSGWESIWEGCFYGD